ncbi:chlorohydrolase family protein [Aspergillus clavatus NRRL 1]|uniref:Probable guanine deaminase n=1 Tax=Aspergillus clavatus (strain ATCC 1007 / CBS 513.65 / DSM 816 / NCTC 3887 / NRRL 1 / QM 1276 / 107) TaxID=344612 RepID=A1C996_ASPCL|nr:chlorohydrolase family protein [Aspergillus clavatus NRRL 1]EAW13420.1 chlorohydrolase family protein [Aspergillus clavatus NRRL 1]
MAAYNLFVGTFIHLPRTPSADGKHALDINHGALWVSTSSGRIEGCDWSVRSDADIHTLLKKNGWTQETVKITKAREEENEFFFPGFIDTHIHAPQYPNTGIFGSSTLLDWLETYTFPLESSFSNLAKARTVYDTVISRTLANGTTCASYFATIHVPATTLLADLCHARGQRALIGRVCMDNPAFCPDYYRDESAEASLEKTKQVVSHIHALAATAAPTPATSNSDTKPTPTTPLIHPILTPRFAPTCSPAAMRGLAALAASVSPPLHIQTHIAENKSELDLVRSLFPAQPSYAAVYDVHGLLTPRTILAHGVYLSAPERSLIAARGAKISHCPASNSALGSGMCPVRDLLDAGLTVGLGTDVSGGYSPSILEAVRQACLVSRLVEAGREPGPGRETASAVLSVEEGLYLATRGGAAVVDMAAELGGFELGMVWDAQMVRLGGAVRDGDASSNCCRAANGTVDVFGWESWVEKVHKWVWSGDDRNVRAVWVRGRLVHSLASAASTATATGASGWTWKWTWLCGAGLVGAWFAFDRVMR